LANAVWRQVGCARSHTHNKALRLEIVAPRLGRGIRLCSTRAGDPCPGRSTDTFSRFLATPFGPDGEPKSLERRARARVVPPWIERGGEMDEF